MVRLQLYSCTAYITEQVVYFLKLLDRVYRAGDQISHNQSKVDIHLLISKRLGIPLVSNK